MEREVRLLLWSAIIFGCLFAVDIGIAAGGLGMIQGPLAASMARMITTPFVARMWR